MGDANASNSHPPEGAVSTSSVHSACKHKRTAITVVPKPPGRPLVHHLGIRKGTVAVETAGALARGYGSTIQLLRRLKWNTATYEVRATANC